MPHEFDPDALGSAEADIRSRLAGRPVDLEVQRATSNLYRAAGVVSRRAEREMLTDLGLSWSAFVSMWVLWVWGEMDATRLAHEVGLTPGTVTGVRKGLEKQGYVESRRAEDDARRVLVSLTELGDATFNEFYPRFNAWTSELFGELSAEATIELADLLERIILRPGPDVSEA